MMNTCIAMLIATAGLLMGGTAGAQTIRNDFADFSAGKFLRYSTKSHPKAGSVELSVKYPISWKSDEGNKPHVVRQMTRSIGALTYALTIVITDPMERDRVIPAEEIEEMFQAPDWAEEFFPAPAVVHSQSGTKFEGLSAGMAEVTQFAERLGLRFRMRSQALAFVCNNRMVLLSVSVGTLDSNSHDLDAKFTEARPLFFSMLNGATLGNAWKPPTDTNPIRKFIGGGPDSAEDAERPAPAGNPLDNPLGEGFWPAFLVALVLTWTIGPSPAVILRFAVYRRPVTAGIAQVYALVISALFWIGGAVIHEMTEEPGTYRGIVWIVMFGVSRAILGWRSKSQDGNAGATPATVTTATPQLSAGNASIYPGEAPPDGAVPVMTAIPVVITAPPKRGSAQPPPPPPLKPPASKPPVAAAAAKPMLPTVPRLPPPLPPKKPKPPGSA